MTRESLTSESKKLKEDFVPLEERQSKHLNIVSYIKDIFPVFLSGALGSGIGWLAGKSAESKNIALPGFMKSYGQIFGHSGNFDRNIGKWVGAKIGAIVGVYHHWKKSEGKRAGVNNINSDLKEAIFPEYLAREVEQEKQILKDIKYIQNHQGAHVQKEQLRRDASPDSQRAY